MTENRHIRRYAARTASARGVCRASWPRFPLLALLALAIQILVVQTHVHVPPGVDGSRPIASFAIQTVDDAANGPGKQNPLSDDPSNCPICQQIAQSSQFVHSTAVLAAPLVFVSVHFVVFSEALPSRFAVSHNWRGRAPPRT